MSFRILKYAGWLKAVSHDGWLGVLFPETLARWQWRAGIFFPGTLNINEDWRRNIPIVAVTLYEQFCQKWSLGTPEVMEHVIYRNIMQHLEHNNILYSKQHGFRKNHSCETQLLLTIEDLAKNLDEGSEVDLQIFDFSKAFDKVPHQRLLSKLNYYGIQGKTLAWIISWLTERSFQRVGVDSEGSSLVRVISGLEYHRVQFWPLPCFYYL